MVLVGDSNVDSRSLEDLLDRCTDGVTVLTVSANDSLFAPRLRSTAFPSSPRNSQPLRRDTPVFHSPPSSDAPAGSSSAQPSSSSGGPWWSSEDGPWLDAVREEDEMDV